MLKNLTRRYFQLFEHNNCDLISKMLSDNVELKDWSIKCSGKDKVLNAFNDIFKNVNFLNIDIVNMYCEDLVVISELKIKFSNGFEESVVDIITFDKDNMIVSIHAFKC